MTALVERRPDVIAYRLAPANLGIVGSFVLIAVGVALIAVAAQVRIPLPFTPVPLSGQTFAVLLVGTAYGSRLGLATTAVYVLLGAVGLPIFTNGGSGVEHLTGATGGYLVGFAVAAFVAGTFAERRYDRHLVPALVGMTIASFVIYLFGAGWLVLSLGLDVPTAVSQGILPFVLGDALKAVLAAAALPIAWRLVDRATQRD